MCTNLSRCHKSPHLAGLWLPARGGFSQWHGGQEWQCHRNAEWKTSGKACYTSSINPKQEITTQYVVYTFKLFKFSLEIVFFQKVLICWRCFLLLRVSKNHIGNHWKHGRNHKIWLVPNTQIDGLLQELQTMSMVFWEGLWGLAAPILLKWTLWILFFKCSEGLWCRCNCCSMVFVSIKDRDAQKRKATINPSSSCTRISI